MAKKKTVIGGPHVAFAVICENFIEQKTGLLSLINLLDVMTLHGDAKEFTPGAVQFTLAIGFKSGDFIGKKELTIRPIKPGGEIGVVNQKELIFKGANSGSNMLITMLLGVSATGLYWFEIVLGGHVATRIPLLIQYEQSKPETSAKQKSPAHVGRAHQSSPKQPKKN